MAKKTQTEAPSMDLSFDTWSRMMDQQWGRLDELVEEIGRRQAQAIDQTNTALAEVTKMAQSSLSFSNEISQEWLGAARGTTRWATDLVTSWAR